MTWKVLSMVAVAGIAALLHYETENDILYVEKEVVVPVTRAKAFLFIADMSNYRRVGFLLFDNLHKSNYNLKFVIITYGTWCYYSRAISLLGTKF